MRIALDTNIFVYAIERKDKYGDAARRLLEKIREEKDQVYTSVLTLHEILVGVHKRGFENKIPAILEYIAARGLVTIVDYDRQVALKSALIRAKYGLKTPDSIHIACAMHAKAKKFITTDRRLVRKIEGLDIVLLN